MEETKPSFWGMCNHTRADKANGVRVVVWSLSWTVAWVASTLGFSKGWIPAGLPTYASILLTVGLGAGLILAYRRFLAETDEMRRMIELEGIAFGGGMGLVGGIAIFLLAKAGVIESAEITDVVVITCMSYVLGVLNGHRRYS